MARKKQEIQLQREIETQEEWEEVMAMEGLWVVDVYQEWCGPCAALVGNFRRLKNELGDPLLNYAIAKADTIDALEKYRGRCEPTFLFFAGGILVAFIHGANSPKVQRVITEQLAQEHKVLEGTGERKEVKDPIITRMQERELEMQEAEEAAREAEEPKGVTVAIIKPDAVAAGKTDSIIAEMEEKGIEILAREERELTDEEAREMYNELENEDYYEELIKFITSGPSHVLVLTKGDTGENIVTDWRDMIGPTNVEQAQEEAPDSLRAKYGEKGYMNGVHGSSSKETAAKELAFFFPSLSIPTYLKKKESIQRTLALIRPEAFNNSKDEILQKIQEAGFSIALYKEIQLTKEQAADFYKEHEGSTYFDELVSLMSSGPLLALGLARDEAITAWRDMLGPNNVDEAQEANPQCFRAKYTGESGINQFHGSDSEETAKKEIDFFFPMEETVGVIKPAAMGTKDAIIEKIHEAGFRIAAHKETLITREIADILYPNQQEKDYYDDLVNSITSGPTYFMVLSRENAVEGWRKVVGDTDPEQAKTNNPDSLRALFGEDVLNNAVHGSSNVERAREEMKAVFGDLEFNEDGTVKGQEPDLDEATVDKTQTQNTTDDTSMDQTTMDQDTTQEPSADVTADTAPEGDQTQADTTQMDETQADTTVDETTVGDTTVDETTAGDTTVAEGDTGEETQAKTAEPTPEEGSQEAGDQTATGETTADQTTVDQTTADQTTADSTTADTTTVDTTTADTTAEATTAEQTPAPEESQTEEQKQEPQEGEATTQQQESGKATPEQQESGEATTQQQESGEATTQQQESEESTQQQEQPEQQEKPASPAQQEESKEGEEIPKEETPKAEDTGQEQGDTKTEESPAGGDQPAA